jgi:glycosyltransferase involved in cell wall biosynthesis
MRRGFNVSPLSKHMQDFIQDSDDVLVFVDGDDWLYDEKVLEKLNEFYKEGDYWMTYGGLVCYPSGMLGNPQNTPYPKEVRLANAYRRDMWRASHLRTFKWGLYSKIKEESMIYSKTGKYYFHAEDLATSYPCLEMCPENKVGLVEFYSYIFNETPSNRERGLVREAEAGIELEIEIRNQIPYKKIDSIL